MEWLLASMKLFASLSVTSGLHIVGLSDAKMLKAMLEAKETQTSACKVLVKFS